ncbi:hypothetical protein Ddc_18718 [Ditylenchus destructor]|nr:hypothetical protein Ddc_18718 [Ditylenchus destructor]
MGAYVKINHPKNSSRTSNTSKILVILSLTFGLAIGMIFGLFLAKLPFSKIFTTFPIEQHDDKTVAENLCSQSISHRHSNDTVKVHPKTSRRGRPIIYTCGLEDSLSLFPYKLNYSLSNAHRRRPPRMEFFRHLDSGNQTFYMRTKGNPNLTKGEIADAIEMWLQTLPKKVQSIYTEWQANVTQRREQFVDNVKTNLTIPAIQLFHKILSIVDDRSLTRKETNRRIDEFILNSAIKPWLELNRALGNAVCRSLRLSVLDEDEKKDERSEFEKSVDQYRDILPLLEDRDNKNKIFTAESGGDTLVEETLRRSLQFYRSTWGMDPVEPAQLEYGRSTNNQ